MKRQSRSLASVADELGDMDEIEDAVYDLRGEVFHRMKKQGFYAEEDVGSEHQREIDAVIRLLLEMV